MEIFTGSEKGTIGSAGVCTPQGCRYIDNGNHDTNAIYLHGEWEQGKQFVQHTSDKEGHIAVKYSGKEAEVTMEATGNVNVDIRLNDKPLTKENAGKDVKFNNRRSYVSVEKKKSYSIVKLKSAGMHELKIITNSSMLRIYFYSIK